MITVPEGSDEGLSGPLFLRVIKHSRGIEPRLCWPFARPVSACPKAFLGFVQTELSESGEETFDPLERRLAEN